MSGNKLESWGHRTLGFGAELTNTRLLLDRRERKQLPPENKRNPVMWVLEGREGDGTHKAYPSPHPELQGQKFGREYWSRVRTMDTLNDLREYNQGATAAWFVLVGGCIGLGIWVGTLL